MRDEPIDKSRALVELRRICVDTLRIDDPDYAVMMSAIEALSSVVRNEVIEECADACYDESEKLTAKAIEAGQRGWQNSARECHAKASEAWACGEKILALKHAAPGQGRDASALPGRPVAQDAHAPVSAPAHPEERAIPTPRTNAAIEPSASVREMDFVPADFARRLERELADSRKWRGVMQEIADRNQRRVAELEAKAEALSAIGAIPTGWRLVPEEATAEMVQAAEDRHVEGASYIAENSVVFALWREVWKAMLRAAPKAAAPSSVARSEVEPKS